MAITFNSVLVVFDRKIVCVYPVVVAALAVIAVRVVPRTELFGAQPNLGDTENTAGQECDDEVSVFATGTVLLFTKQICVPSAYRTKSPLALLPCSMIAPVGTPPDWETVPRMLSGV